MKKSILLLLLLSMIIPTIGQSQNKKAIKELGNIIDSHDLILFSEGKFTKGICSLHGSDRIQSLDHNLFVQDIPYREDCTAFLLCDHEVTVKEYLDFIFQVSGKENINQIKKEEFYSFLLNQKKITINIIPSISFMAKKEKVYLIDDTYSEFPIIGINWLQANAYIHWLNQKLSNIKSENNLSVNSINFILPNSEQWEYAAAIYKDTKDNKKKIREIKYYPFDGFELTDEKGQYKANFGNITTEFGVCLKPLPSEGFSQIKPTKSYNSYNKLYDMAGNVSEWTATKINNEDYSGVIVKGGSFVSPPIYMQNGVHQLYEETYQSNEIGFRIGLILNDDLMKIIEFK